MQKLKKKLRDRPAKKLKSKLFKLVRVVCDSKVN